MVVPTRLANSTRAVGLDVVAPSFIVGPKVPSRRFCHQAGSRRPCPLSGNTPAKWGLACSDVVKWRRRVVAPGQDPPVRIDEVAMNLFNAQRSAIAIALGTVLALGASTQAFARTHPEQDQQKAAAKQHQDKQHQDADE